MAKKNHGFPQVVYVNVEGRDTREEFFNVDEDADGVANGEKVAVYELREVLTKRVTHELK